MPFFSKRRVVFDPEALDMDSEEDILARFAVNMRRTPFPVDVSPDNSEVSIDESLFEKPKSADPKLPSTSQSVPMQDHNINEAVLPDQMPEHHPKTLRFSKKFLPQICSTPLIATIVSSRLVKEGSAPNSAVIPDGNQLVSPIELSPIGTKPAEVNDEKLEEPRLEICGAMPENPIEMEPEDEILVFSPKPKNSSKSKLKQSKKKLIQAVIKLPIKKKIRKNDAKTYSLRPGTPDLAVQPRYAREPYKEMRLIASDSEAENEAIALNSMPANRSEAMQVDVSNAPVELVQSGATFYEAFVLVERLSESEIIRRTVETPVEQEIELNLIDEDVNKDDYVQDSPNQRKTVEKRVAKDTYTAKQKTKKSRIIESEEENDDELDSEDSNLDIIYDPKDRGCKREGLRVRRQARPYWIHDGTEKNYVISYKEPSIRETMLEAKLLKEMKVNHISACQLLPNLFIGGMLSAEDKLERLERIKRERNREQVPKPAPKTKFDKFIHKLKNLPTFDSRKAWKKFCKTKSILLSDTTVVDDLKFGPAQEGVSYALINAISGVFQIAPGCQKKESRAKRSYLSFFLLSGELKLKLEKKIVVMKAFCFQYISLKQTYSLENRGAEPAFVLFHRLPTTEE